jgi:hypothetical protein
MFIGMRGGPGGTKETDPAKVAELSEKDPMNVLEMARKEFNVDDNRIYLMADVIFGSPLLLLLCRHLWCRPRLRICRRPENRALRQVY